MLHRTAVLVFAVAFALSCGPAPDPAPDPDYRAEIDAWHAQREARLAAADGWLSLVGLHWLEEGPNPIGNDPSAAVPLEAPGIPPEAGTILLEGEDLTIEPHAGAAILLGGVAVTGHRTVATDAADGGPDVYSIGRLRFHVIERGGRFAVRVKDPQAPTRTTFEGVPRFPVDPAYRVRARYEPYDTPREVTIGTAAGTEDTALAGGRLRFALNGQELTLEPWVSGTGDTDLFLVFADATSGETTYGAGRFLSATAQDDGTAILDFNRAVSPPCAFTPYATCPLPPATNVLQVAVEAGERHHGSH